MQFSGTPRKRMKKFGRILKIDDAAAKVRVRLRVVRLG